MTELSKDELYESARNRLDLLWERLGSVPESEDSDFTALVKEIITVGTVSQRYALITQLLQKLELPGVDCRQLKKLPGAPNGFSSRSLALNVVMPFNFDHGAHLGRKTKDPYSSQPVRRERLDVNGTAPQDRAIWEALMSALTAVEGDSALPEPALATALRAVREIEPEDEQPEVAEGDEDELRRRVEEWHEERGYPTDKDEERKAQRVELAEALSEQRLDEVIEDPGKFDTLKFSVFAHRAYGGPGPQSIVQKHLNEGPEAKRRLAEALRHLLYDEGDVADRLDDVLLKDQWRAPGFGESLATKSLAVLFPESWLPLFQYSGEKGKLRLAESPELGIQVPKGFEEQSLGAKVRWTNDRLRERMEPHLPNDPWGQTQFLYWLRDQAPEGEVDGGTLSELADRLLVDPAWLSEVVELLEEKRQVVFQGPPGTGKTYVARELGKHFERLGGKTETVQFHPSYAYEDFVEGYRPRVVEGQPGFELVEGPLKRLALNAQADPDNKYILIIDELNRGNVAKVFGELYFLLEYRGDKIRLQYTEDGEKGSAADSGGFGLPKNLWIVATMNTADRSIALMDAALRRRFYFIDYYPDEAPIAGLLERWLKRNELDELLWVASALEEANTRLADRDAAVGPSHFLLHDPSDLTEKRVQRIWRHAVIPYIEERLIGEPERMAEFSLGALRGIESPEASADAPDEATPEAEAPDAPGPDAG